MRLGSEKTQQEMQEGWYDWWSIKQCTQCLSRRMQSLLMKTLLAIVNHLGRLDTTIYYSILPENPENIRYSEYGVRASQYRYRYVELKLKRLHFIRSTESGAKVAGKAPMKHSPFSSSSTSSFPKWFQCSTDDNYNAFRQFTKGRYNS
jgi:hypothetical protein